MTKGLLIYRVDFSDTANHGVALKALGQAEAYRNCGVALDLISIKKDTIFLNEKEIGRLSGLYKRIRYHRGFWNILKKIDLSPYDFIHIRYPYATPWFLSFVNKKKSRSKLLLELPTYPYENEFVGINKILLQIDKYYRSQIFRVTDAIIHYGQEKELFGTPCINISNGIDVTSFPIRHKKEYSTSLSMIAVGKWQYWHGLDRLIKGIALVKDKSKYNLIIIGVGPANPKLEALLVQYDLGKNIHFVGNKKGSDLDPFFDKADIAIGTLAMHRKNVFLDASLKHREYAARGIPFIYSGRDLDFDTADFVYQVPGDEKPIHIDSLIESMFWQKNRAEEIRNYAESYLSWEKRIRYLLDH